jgi:hypothetical protein
MEGERRRENKALTTDDHQAIATIERREDDGATEGTGPDGGQQP